MLPRVLSMLYWDMERGCGVIRLGMVGEGRGLTLVRSISSIVSLMMQN